MINTNFSFMRTRTMLWIMIAVVIVIAIGAVLYATVQDSNAPSNQTSSSGKILQVVAAENFWGSIVSQIGGSHVQVLSIVSDPNADPHEYESNAADARAVATA